MADRYWNGSVDGDWNTAANWTPAAVPLATENVFIVETAVSIDGFDASGTALGNVTVGPGFSGNIGATGDYLILNLGATQRISIDGAAASTLQEIWIDYNGSTTDIDINSYGNVDVAAQATKGVHLKRTAGTLSVTNGGAPVTLDSGTFANLIDAGSASPTIGSVVSASAVLTNYKMQAAGAVATLNVSPTTIEVSLGTVDLDGTGLDVIDVQVWSGILNWNSGAGITSLVTVRGGGFDTSQATIQATIADVVVYGTSATTSVDLRMAAITNNIKVHGTPTIKYPSSSLGTLA